jgi:ribosomal protein S18 acetylase RimI-like enzyme
MTTVRFRNTLNGTNAGDVVHVTQGTHEPSVEVVALPAEAWREYKALRLRALKTEPQAFGSTLAEMERSMNESWQRRLQDVIDGKSHLLFARLCGNLVGMVGAFQEEEDRNSSTTYIYGMYVDFDARSRGIGRMLLSRLLENLAESGIARAKLDVSTDQLAARQLYISLGFVVTGSNVQTLGDGKQHVELRMELPVDSGRR